MFCGLFQLDKHSKVFVKNGYVLVCNGLKFPVDTSISNLSVRYANMISFFYNFPRSLL